MTLSFPLVISNVINTLYSLADGLWLAQLSSTQFAATSFVWPILFLFISLAIGMSIAGTSIIAQLIGAEQKKRASDYANHLIVMSIIVGIVVTIVGTLITPHILTWMGAGEDLYDYSLDYVRINIFGFVVDSLFFAFQAILNAQGKTKDTTIIGALSGIVNIVLDPILIFTNIPFINLPGLGLEVKGAAIATVISKVVAVAIGAYRINHDKSELDVSLKGFKWNRNMASHIMKVAFPTAIGRSSSALGFIIMNGFIISYGPQVVAAFSMVNRITDFWMQISMGIGAAMTSIIAQNIGAKQIDRAKETIKEAKVLVWITSLIGILILVFFTDGVLSIFVNKAKEPMVFAHALDYMKYDIFMIPPMGLFNIYLGIFQGTGKTRYSMNMSMGRLWFIRIPMVLIFKNFTGLEQTGIWISMLVSNIVIILYALTIFRTKKIIED